jgi:hypothetical protein
MGAAAAIPAVLSIASAGFNFAGSRTQAEGAQLQAEGAQVQAQGVAAGDIYKAEVLEQQAQYGELKATQTNAQLTRNLSITLGNIDAVRAAAHGDPNDPTNAAVRDYVEQTGTEQKGIKVASIEQQAREDESNAAYLRAASSQALLSGNIAAQGDMLTSQADLLSGDANLLKGLGGAFKSGVG